MSILRTISMDIHEQKNEIKEIKSSFNEKLDVQNSNFNTKFHEQNIKFDIINSRFDEINKQNAKFEVNINKRFDEMLDKNNGYVVENEVSKNDTVSDNSDNESRELVEVEFKNEVLLANADESEREYEESIQRVKFSCGAVVGEENASRVYLGDVWSTNNCPLIFCASGKARMCCNNVVLPSVWNENMKCCEKYCDESDYERERERERVVEIFKVNRDYEILVQSL